MGSILRYAEPSSQNIGDRPSGIPASSNRGMDLIEKDIQVKDYKGAVKKLLFLLLDPKILDLEKAFEYLLVLFPYIDEDEKSFGHLLLRLPDFLNLTSHFSEQQNHLALQLGKALCKRKEHPLAMNCLAQALKSVNREVI